MDKPETVGANPYPYIVSCHVSVNAVIVGNVFTLNERESGGVSE